MIAVCWISVAPAHAIPSPELIVGSVASLSQIGALVAAILGGGATLALRGRAGKAGSAAAASVRRLGRIALAFGLLAAILASLNIYQWAAARAAVEQRLSATLSRPARLPGQPRLDPTLKELGPAEQARHPLGLTAAEAEAIIPRARELGYEIVDIRETAEVEMGTFAGAQAIRYPDFMQQQAGLEGRKALLICHNGNRSSETCQALAEKGIACRFVVGGLERFISEGRTASGFSRASILEARAVPAYPNNMRLIDTPEARGLIEQEGAVVVDVRYPGEFAAGHLPGAINVPMRRMTTADLTAAFERLPEGPVLVACYDRRSCFFGELAGLTLSRLGRDFRGRYTVPWDYVPTQPVPAHVAAAIAERDLGLWARAQRWLARAIDGLAGQWGFMTVLLGLALASRLVILPFALKSDRDQIVAARIEPEVAAMKVRLADDPVRRGRALSQLYKRHGLTPLRNLLALLGLPVLMLAGAALADAARIGGHSHPLVGSLGDPDPTCLLAVAGGVLIGLYVDRVLCTGRRHRLLNWLAVTPLFVVVLAFLPAATNLYVVASMVLLSMQRLAAVLGPRLTFAGLVAIRPARSEVAYPVALSRVAGRADVGNKASRLGELIAAGMPVPDGIVLTTRFLATWKSASRSERRRRCRRIVRAAGRGPYAVRSSASAEDQADASHAGVYDTVTNVEPHDLAGAIDRVLASFASDRAASYGTDAGDGAVIVQRMIRATFGGVLFTRAPDAPGQALVEFVEGAAEGLVSGRGRPVTLRFGRRSGQPMDGTAAPVDLEPLLTLGREIEARFGVPQDIEWVAEGQRFWIVQARDITAGIADEPPIVMAEWEKVLALVEGPAAELGGPPLVRNEMCELLPRPTHASHSLIEALHASGGSVDLACRALGLSYPVEEDAPALFPMVFGRLYHNAGEARRRAPRISKLDIRRLERQADGIEQTLRRETLPVLAARFDLEAAIDFDALDTRRLKQAVADIAASFVTSTHVEAEVVNIVAELVVSDARAQLIAAGLEPSLWLARHEATLEDVAFGRAAVMPAADGLVELLVTMGHRGTMDYELASPRFAEDTSALAVRLAAMIAARAAVQPPANRGELEPRLGALVQLAGRMQVLKDDVKHVILAEVAVMRRALLALDRRMGLGGEIFHLTLDEIRALDTEAIDEARRLIELRRHEAIVLNGAVSLPASLRLDAVERASLRGGIVERRPAGGSLVGTRVAGTVVARGRAFVVDAEAADRGDPLSGFLPGDIIVAPFVHPSWLGDMLAATGVVSGSGGWLSHMAIVARERGVAMIVGVEHWETIQPNSRVCLGLDGTIIVEAGAEPGLAVAAE
jgi:rhodanese-related sulfurtransferase/phosphohistidine swiveling domain-containing protein